MYFNLFGFSNFLGHGTHFLNIAPKPKTMNKFFNDAHCSRKKNHHGSLIYRQDCLSKIAQNNFNNNFKIFHKNKPILRL